MNHPDTAPGLASRFVFHGFDKPAGLSTWFVFAVLGCAVGTFIDDVVSPGRFEP